MKDRVWIGEVRGRYIRTVLVTAATRKEAEKKIRTPRAYPNDIEDLSCNDYTPGPGRILREDK